MSTTQSILKTAPRVFTFLLLAVCSLAGAQDEESAKTVAGFGELDRIFGEGAYIGYEGLFDALYGEESGGLIELTITGDVRIRSDKLDLDCDFLKYDVKKDWIIATGKAKHPVKLRQGKTVTASCQRLEIYPNEEKSILTGHPVVRQKGVKSMAKTITIIQQKDGMRVLFDSGGQGQMEIGDGKVKNRQPAEIIMDDPAAFSGAGNGEEKPAAEPPSRIVKPTPEPLNKPASSKMPSVSE
jgi:lipopolysaccharide export system protein LptA